MTAPAVHPGGRPRVHDREALMRLACARIAQGQLVRDVADSLGLHYQRIPEWGALPEFAEAYARARQSQAWTMAEDAIRIADGIDVASQERVAAMVSAIQGVDDDDKERILNSLTNAAVQRDRIRVDARKWMVAKVYPRVFGDNRTLTVDIGEGLAERMRQGQSRVQARVIAELPAEAIGHTIVADDASEPE